MGYSMACEDQSDLLLRSGVQKNPLGLWLNVSISTPKLDQIYKIWIT